MKGVSNQGGEAIESAAHVDGGCAEINVNGGGEAEHGIGLIRKRGEGEKGFQ